MMENLITVAILFSEVTTLMVLGLLIFMCLIPIYDRLKKGIKIEKKQSKQEYDWVAIFDEMFERSKEHEKK